MKPVETLQALARGERPVDGLLPPCRLEALGTQAYGEEAIIHHFRARPFGAMDSCLAVNANSHVALFTKDAGLFADIYDSRILRIWRLGTGEPCAAEPSIGVAFDTDLFQARRDVRMRADDYSELHPDALERLRLIGYTLAHGWAGSDKAPPWRRRPFLLRAFSEGTRSAALFAVHRIGADQRRTVGFSFAAAIFDLADGSSDDELVIRDLAGEQAIAQRPWRTQFA